MSKQALTSKPWCSPARGGQCTSVASISIKLPSYEIDLWIWVRVGVGHLKWKGGDVLYPPGRSPHKWVDKCMNIGSTQRRHVNSNLPIGIHFNKCDPVSINTLPYVFIVGIHGQIPYLISSSHQSYNKQTRAQRTTCRTLLAVLVCSHCLFFWYPVTSPQIPFHIILYNNKPYMLKVWAMSTVITEERKWRRRLTQKKVYPRVMVLYLK